MDKKKERTIQLIMAVIMSACMGIVATVVIAGDPKSQTPPFPVFLLLNLGESIAVGIAIALIIPFGKMGQALARKAKAVPPSGKFQLLNAIPFAVGNSVLVSAVVSFINVALAHAKIPADQAPPLPVMWFGSWAPLLLPSILISYVLALLVAPIVVKAVMGGRKPNM